MYTPTKTGDTVKILQLLSLGYSPIQKFAEAENGTPLHVAASEGHVLTSHILVQAGAELDAIDDEKNTPLMLGTIHILRKHFYSTKLNLTPKLFTKTVCFCQTELSMHYLLALYIAQSIPMLRCHTI